MGHRNGSQLVGDEFNGYFFSDTADYHIHTYVALEDLYLDGVAQSITNPWHDVTWGPNGELSGIPHQILELQGMVEIATDDVNASLRLLAENVTDLNRMKIRQPNLEDLFLDLTGHSLRA